MSDEASFKDHKVVSLEKSVIGMDREERKQFGVDLVYCYFIHFYNEEVCEILLMNMYCNTFIYLLFVCLFERMV